jgi:hypothetical protein
MSLSMPIGREVKWVAAVALKLAAAAANRLKSDEYGVLHDQSAVPPASEPSDTRTLLA